jgi:hypothetical protein
MNDVHPDLGAVIGESTSSGRRPTAGPTSDPMIISSRSTGRRLRYRRHRLSELSLAEFTRLHSAMGRLMHDTVAATEDPAWADTLWERRRQALRENACACLAYDAERLVGFMTYELFRIGGRTCVHLGSCYVEPRVHGRGVAFSLAARIGFAHFALTPFVDLYFTTNVINPLAVRAWRARSPIPRSQHLYPPLDGHPADPALVSMATEIATRQFPELHFDPRLGVLRDAGLPRGAGTHASGDAEIDAFFDRHVDPCQGESVLLLFDASRRVILHNLGQLLAAVPRATIARPGRRRRRVPPPR